MDRTDELLELLNTPILSFVDSILIIEKTIVQYIVTCFHVSQYKEASLQTQTRVLHDALEQKHLQQHSKLVSVTVFFKKKTMFVHINRHLKLNVRDLTPLIPQVGAIIYFTCNKG